MSQVYGIELRGNMLVDVSNIKSIKTLDSDFSWTGIKHLKIMETLWKTFKNYGIFLNYQRQHVTLISLVEMMIK